MLIVCAITLAVAIAASGTHAELYAVQLTRPQCEQTLHGTGCTKVGVCGKTAQVAMLQDLLVYQLKGLGAWASFAHERAGIVVPEVASFMKAAIFATLTNVCVHQTAPMPRKWAIKPGLPMLVAPSTPALLHSCVHR